jgi:hypothetical protein
MRGDERAWCRVLVRGEARGAGARDPARRGAERGRGVQRVYSRLFGLWERDAPVDSRDDAPPVDSTAQGVFCKMTKT